jgi:hypothetical protein
MYSYCYVRSVLGMLFHCVVLCTVPLPPGVNPISVNRIYQDKYIKNLFIIQIFRLYTGWTTQVSSPGGGEIVSTLSTQPWGLPSLLQNVYRVPFPGVKRLLRGLDHPLHLAPKLKKQ